MYLGDSLCQIENYLRVFGPETIPFSFGVFSRFSKLNSLSSFKAWNHTVLNAAFQLVGFQCQIGLKLLFEANQEYPNEDQGRV